MKLKVFSLSLLLCISHLALASDTTKTTLPYESWLRTIQSSLTGPVAFSIALIGIVSCGATLIFAGGELNKFMRSLVYLVLVMTLLIGANSLMKSLFNGATIEAQIVDSSFEQVVAPDLMLKPDYLKALNYEDSSALC